jgi:hypothetical protein
METHPIPSAQSTPSTSKPPSKALFLVFALFIILISIGIGIMFYNNTKPTVSNTGKQPQDLQGLKNQAEEFMKQNGSNNKNTTQPTIIQPEQATTNASGQTTYQNKSAKFSISYPKDLQIKETPQGFGVSSIEFRNAANSAVPADYQLLVFPKFLGKTIGQDFDASYASSNNTTTIIKAPSGSSEQRLTKIRNRSVGGQRAFDFRATANPENPKESADVGTYVEIGNSVVVFSTAESKRSALDSLLMTFKYPI